MAKLRVLDLFSGLGGFSVGLERAGSFETIAFVENNEPAQKILARHWPGVPCLGDVSAAEFPDADIITAGFPCQDISLAGRGAGLAGARSGLFWEVVRAIRVVRPVYVLLENVAALLGRGMGTVAGALAESGYDAEWDCIPAASVGAPHIRDRAWVVAYPSSGKRRSILVACDRLAWRDTLPQRKEGSGAPEGLLEAAWGDDAVMVADTLSRMDDGVRFRLDGYNRCANAVVPQIPEMIGRAILAAEAARTQEPAR
ncbi:DNA (cytosine-5-)-methyltransferase (plasmid) [Azospirillum sp. A26]|uniref:DNA cytosine methyltransferase n=1 Tax=Azospirillum sp. A26 TaxID=3160607 RepID=UPI00366D72AF